MKTLKYAIFVTRDMVLVEVEDSRSVCRVTEGYLPSLERLMKARPVRPTGHYDKAVSAISSRDRAAVWLYATLAQRAASFWIDPSQLGIEVWMLSASPTPSGRFTEWFDSQSADYRMFLLRHAKPAQGTRLVSVFGGLDNRIGLRHRTGTYYHLLPSAKSFLQEVVEAYNSSPPNVLKTVHATGHPYIYSTGFPV